MRHYVKGKKLNRDSSHRKALLSNLASQLFEHKQIKTTVAKAKEARRFAEKMITLGKKGDLNSFRQALKFLRRKETVYTLFKEIAPVYKERNGGYTRVLRIGFRKGDAAEKALLQLVDFENFKKEETKGQVEEAKVVEEKKED